MTLWSLAAGTFAVIAHISRTGKQSECYGVTMQLVGAAIFSQLEAWRTGRDIL